MRSYLEEREKDQIGGPQIAGDKINLLQGVVEIDNALNEQLNDGQPLDDSLAQQMSAFSSRFEQWASEVAESLEALILQNSNRDESLKGKQKELVELTDLYELMDAWPEMDQFVQAAWREEKLATQKPEHQAFFKESQILPIVPASNWSIAISRVSSKQNVDNSACRSSNCNFLVARERRNERKHWRATISPLGFFRRESSGLWQSPTL